MRCLLVIFCLVFVNFVIVTGCFSGTRNSILEIHCSKCHSVKVVYEKKRSKKEWRKLVSGMKRRGLKLTPEEEKEVFDALFENYSVE